VHSSFYGVQRFDLVLELDEVLEFVSPDISKRNIFDEPQEYNASEESNAQLQLGC
jgi:hypothetical protein